ncbi:BRO-N domain-containing protein [Aeromonas allosaccharophila]|uniref:BRO-N domain-containing protein n=1 Tax=Aeromonas allosaccharophila TaxID=656 RepID=UPI003D1D6ACD
MNSISFHDTHFTVIPHHGQPWLTATKIAQALGYASEKSISNLYNRNADEFTPCMTLVINSMTKGFGNGSSEKEVRIFSLRGAHLIAMFSRTALAKEFRRWVLDVLDREVERTSDDYAAPLATIDRYSNMLREGDRSNVLLERQLEDRLFLLMEEMNRLRDDMRAIHRNHTIARDLADHIGITARFARPRLG